MKKSLIVVLLLLGALSVKCQTDWPLVWDFDGSLQDRGGRSTFHSLREVKFAQSEGRHALRVTPDDSFSLNEDPSYRMKPGFKFALKVKLHRPNRQGNSTLLSKGYNWDTGGFFLRVDPPDEGGKLSLFTNFDGSPEPRVSSSKAFSFGQWHDVEGGWDGEHVWLSVDGAMSKVAKKGAPVVNFSPLKIGTFDGELDYLAFGGDSTIVDVLAGKQFQDADGKDAKMSYTDALKARSYLNSDPDLQLAPGLRIGCTVRFDQLPTGENTILAKDREYLLRYDFYKGRGYFRIYIFLAGSWEPSASIQHDAEIGKDYRIVAAWDGYSSHIQVNGMAEIKARRGFSEPTSSRLTIGSFPGTLRDLTIENPKYPLPMLEELSIQDLFPRAGQTVTITGELKNYGRPLQDCVVVASSLRGSTVEPKTMAIGDLTGDKPVALSWKVRADQAKSERIFFQIRSGERGISRFNKLVSFAPQKDLDRSSAVWNPVVKATKTYYVDGIEGDNQRDGLTPNTAWRDFTNINGKTLQAGERLLIRRGSVINQELILSANGEPDNYAEIAAYGVGARPTIRRNRHINDRCALITNPEYLVIRDLIVCNAGKGLNVEYVRKIGHGLLIENCLAHHIEGIYRFNSHGIPEWRDQKGAPHGSSGGITITGSRPCDATIRDCETYQCSVGWRASGERIYLDRIYCHDNFAHNTSPHPVLSDAHNSMLVNCIFEAAGWNASAGTMGIMLGNNNSLIIRNCHFTDMRDSGSGDAGGIDFECGGEANLIHQCTFKNNAGAAIEVLGLISPQAKNVEIAECRFAGNNYSKKLGPSEIFVWGNSTDRNVLCSNGLIRDNGYVLHPGVSFFVNNAKPTIKDWMLQNNRKFDDFEQLDKAMPFNNPPTPNAGDEIWTTKRKVALAGTVEDDGRPAKTTLSCAWEQLEGPGNVAFDEPTKAATTATFPGIGDYRLMLKADDGQLWRSSRTAVHILPEGATVAKAWSFARNLDKEGWTDHDLGTVKEIFKAARPIESTFANPVNLVCGDYYVIAIKDSKDARILSPDNLDVKADAMTIKFQNMTNSKQMRLEITADGTSWTSVEFDVKPHDLDDSIYRVNLPKTSTIRQMRLNFSDGKTPVTGTCRIDYIWLGTWK